MTDHTAWFHRFAGPGTATLMDHRSRNALAAVQADYPQPTTGPWDDHSPHPARRWTNTNPK